MDTIGTLKALARYMPKDVLIENNSSRAADAMTDAELAQVIADRAMRDMGIPDSDSDAPYMQ